MQHEMWTRFALPFVRLDSVGIQRVRRSCPRRATRSPVQAGDHLDRHPQERPLPRPPAQAPLGCRRHRRVAQRHQLADAEQPSRPRARTQHRRADPRERDAAQRQEGVVRRAGPAARAHRGHARRRHRRGRGAAARRAPSPAQPRGRRRGGCRLGRARRAAQPPRHRPRPRRMPSPTSSPTTGSTPPGSALLGRTNSSGDALFAWTLAKAFLSSPAALAETAASAAPSSARSTRRSIPRDRVP